MPPLNICEKNTRSSAGVTRTIYMMIMTTRVNVIRCVDSELEYAVDLAEAPRCEHVRRNCDECLSAFIRFALQNASRTKGITIAIRKWVHRYVISNARLRRIAPVATKYTVLLL